MQRIDLTEEERDRVLGLRAQSHSLHRICEITGFKLGSVYRVITNRERPSRAVIKERKQKAMELHAQGKNRIQIGEELGLNGQQVKYLFRDEKSWTAERRRKCKYEPCSSEFTANRKFQEFCSRRCSYLHAKCKNPGPTVICAAVGCNKPFNKPKIQKTNFCCAKCSYTEALRWRVDGALSQCGHGVYKKIFMRKPVCSVCGEWRTVQEHHIVFSSHKSDKTSPTVFLCPNHHFLIHNGFATYTAETGYVELDCDFVKAEVERKQGEKLAAVRPLWELKANSVADVRSNSRRLGGLVDPSLE